LAVRGLEGQEKPPRIGARVRDRWRERKGERVRNRGRHERRRMRRSCWPGVLPSFTVVRSSEWLSSSLSSERALHERDREKERERERERGPRG